MMIRCIYPLVGLLFAICALGAEPPTERITDGKIIGISLTTDEAQIKGSQYANPLITYFDLKNFANVMIADYQNYQNSIIDFSYRSGISPERSEIAAQIEARGKQILDELSKLSGRDLEKRYIAAQLELHVRTLESIDKVFLPNVQNLELRNLVSTIRPAIQNKLDWALRIKGEYR